MTVGQASPASAPALTRELIMGSEVPSVSSPGCGSGAPSAGQALQTFTFKDFEQRRGAARGDTDRYRADGDPAVGQIESSVNLSSGDKAGETKSPPGCMCITMYEGSPSTPRPPQETRDLLLSMGARSAGWTPPGTGAGTVQCSVLRDSLLDAGALCEPWRPRPTGRTSRG